MTTHTHTAGPNDKINNTYEIVSKQRLEAAAPLMLNACEHALTILRMYRYTHPDEWQNIIFPEGNAVIDELILAIYKAKGGD